MLKKRKVDKGFCNLSKDAMLIIFEYFNLNIIIEYDNNLIITIDEDLIDIKVYDLYFTYGNPLCKGVYWMFKTLQFDIVFEYSKYKNDKCKKYIDYFSKKTRNLKFYISFYICGSHKDYNNYYYDKYNVTKKEYVILDVGGFRTPNYYQVVIYSN